MSDNAASGDSPEKSVHPSTGPTATATIEETVNENADPQQPDPNNGFDPDTLANLAALSRIAHVEGSDVDADGEDVVEDGQEDDSALLTRRVTREQVQDMVNSLAIREETGIGEQETDKGGDGDEREVAKDREEDEVDREERDGTGDGETDENGSDDESRSGDEEGALRDPRFIFEGGRLKRKRNRTTL